MVPQRKLDASVILVFACLCSIWNHCAGEQISLKIRTSKGLLSIGNMTGMNASGRVHGYEVEAYVCPEKNIDMTKKAIGMHWAHGRKYLYVQTTCKGRSIVSQILICESLHHKHTTPYLSLCLVQLLKDYLRQCPVWSMIFFSFLATCLMLERG